MKDLSGLVWLTQLGMSVFAPMAGFTLIGVWLRRALGAGAWLTFVFCLIGLISGIQSFRTTLKLLEAREKRKDDAAFKQNHNQHE